MKKVSDYVGVQRMDKRNLGENSIPNYVTQCVCCLWCIDVFFHPIRLPNSLDKTKAGMISYSIWEPFRESKIFTSHYIIFPKNLRKTENMTYPRTKTEMFNMLHALHSNSSYRCKMATCLSRQGAPAATSLKDLSSEGWLVRKTKFLVSLVSRPRQRHLHRRRCIDRTGVPCASLEVCHLKALVAQAVDKWRSLWVETISVLAWQLLTLQRWRCHKNMVIFTAYINYIYS